MTEQMMPPETQRFGRSQTPESPQPLHIPEPSNIPVLENQLDSVFNDTSTYDIRPDSQSLAQASQAEDLQSALPSAVQETPADEESLEHEKGIYQAFAHEPPSASQTLAPFSSSQANTTPSPLQGLFAPYASGQAPQVLVEPNNEFEPYDPVAPSQAFDTAEQATPDQFSVSSISRTNELDHSPSRLAPDHAALPNQGESVRTQEQGIDQESLLAPLVNSTATAPSAENITASTAGVTNDIPSLGEKSLKPISGLPPKPPPRENENTSENLTSYQGFYTSGPQPAPIGIGQLQDASTVTRSAAHASNGFPEHTISVGASGLPPPPETADSQNVFQSYRPSESAPGESVEASPNVERWSLQTQVAYDQFLDDERMYVTEGVWDRFPAGSRLFVGNLPTEKVTKRDLFHVFHRFGKLAQISIKQAYGFVQFLDSQSCHDALAAEQSAEIRGRKVHLEVSKPQKNTRPSGGAGGRPANRRRSRSPVRRDDGLPFSDFRDEPNRRRDDYRPRRSPSPRSYRSRDDYRTRSPRTYGQYDSRPESSGFGSSHQPSMALPFDEDAALPLPRRAPQDVPDIQVLILDEVAPQFVSFVEQGFRQKGLKASTIWLNPRLALDAVIKRQIREGVQAVVKLSRGNQYNSRIPLQVFDRMQGASNVRFNEYVDLDINIAADVVMHQRQKESTLPHTTNTVSYSHNSAFNAQPSYSFTTQHQTPQTPSYHSPTFPSYPPPIVPHHPSTSQMQAPQYQAPNLSAVTPTTPGPNLQELLANLRQPVPPQTQAQQMAVAPPNNRPTDLAGLLSNVAARQYNQSQPYPQTAPSGAYDNNNFPVGYQNHAPTPGYPQGTPDLQGFVHHLQRGQR